MRDLLTQMLMLNHTSVELAINGGFNVDLTGYIARGSSSISWDSSGAMMINVTGAGGGFLSDPIPHTEYDKSYRLSMDLKGITYFGGFKFRLGPVEAVLTESITSDYVTYTQDIHVDFLNQAFEMFRSGTDTGTLLVDNISITKV